MIFNVKYFFVVGNYPPFIVSVKTFAWETFSNGHVPLSFLRMLFFISWSVSTTTWLPFVLSNRYEEVVSNLNFLQINSHV